MDIFPIRIHVFAWLAVISFVRKMFFVPDMPWSFFVISLVVALLGDFVLTLDW